jgi:hypothetical protein
MGCTGVVEGGEQPSGFCLGGTAYGEGSVRSVQHESHAQFRSHALLHACDLRLHTHEQRLLEELTTDDFTTDDGITLGPSEVSLSRDRGVRAG